MNRPLRVIRFLLPVLCLAVLVPMSEAAPTDEATALHREYTLNGEFVHDVGQLQLNVTNFGLIGSTPGAPCSYCDAPSAMWPAGSGVDHLYDSGLWIGARVDGIPVVTTGVRGGRELRADPNDPLQTLYEGFRGAPNGARYPDPMPDDDGDGLEDEDPLNGRDDDGDGAVDEDFAGISDQSFRVELRDDIAAVTESEPNHVPLHVEVIQKSFAWSDEAIDGAIGFEFTIRPSADFSADRVLEDVYVGFFADPDIGPRGSSSIAADDLLGFFDGDVLAIDGSLVPVQAALAYDADGDGGVSPGVFGLALVDHTVDPQGVKAPTEVGLRGFQGFAGALPFEQGGDPGNDLERYDLLSRAEFDPVPDPRQALANDYRFLVSVGPFGELRAGDEITVRWVMFVGEGFDGALATAAEARLVGQGQRFDRDGDPANGQEFRVPWLLASDVPVSIDDPIVPEVDPVATSLRGRLLPNAPNPFNPTTEIRFRLPAASAVSLTIHDAAGRAIRAVDLGHQAAGEGAWVWNGADDAGRVVSSGTYFVRMMTPAGIDARRMVLLK